MRMPEAANAALNEYVARVSGESATALTERAADLIADLLLYVHEQEGEEAALESVRSGCFHYEYESAPGYEDE